MNAGTTNFIMMINEMSGGKSTANNVMTSVKIDGVHFNQNELVSSGVAVKEYGAYIPLNFDNVNAIPTAEYNGEIYIFGVYTLSESAATTYRKGTSAEFTAFLAGATGPTSGGVYAFVNSKLIDD